MSKRGILYKIDESAAIGMWSSCLDPTLLGERYRCVKKVGAMGAFGEGLLSSIELFISFRPTGNLIAEVVRMGGFGSLLGIASWVVICIGVYISLEREGVFRRNPSSRGLTVALMILLIFPFSGVIPVLLYGYYLLGSAAGFMMGVFSGAHLRTSVPFRIGLAVGFVAYVVFVLIAPRPIAASVAGVALVILGWQTYRRDRGTHTLSPAQALILRP